MPLEMIADSALGLILPTWSQDAAVKAGTAGVEP